LPRTPPPPNHHHLNTHTHARTHTHSHTHSHTCPRVRHVTHPHVLAPHRYFAGTNELPQEDGYRCCGAGGCRAQVWSVGRVCRRPRTSVRLFFPFPFHLSCDAIAVAMVTLLWQCCGHGRTTLALMRLAFIDGCTCIALHKLVVIHVSHFTKVW
jgi:hypothetical protein